MIENPDCETLARLVVLSQRKPSNSDEEIIILRDGKYPEVFAKENWMEF